jgi:hypothetical protein
MSRVVSVEPYPFGKRFALTLVDDTDRSRLEEIEPVYACLEAHGLRTTKTVWPLRASALSNGYDLAAGQTLQDLPYRAFCQRLQAAGFEIAMHTASGGDSTRDETFRAYRCFEEIFGGPPLTNIMHGRNRENLYWGRSCTRYRPLAKIIGGLVPFPFEGHDPASDYYWGDLCRERTRYVRLFETTRLNTLAFDPATPYHDPRKPDVPWWFSATYAAQERLLGLVTAEAVDRLAADRGSSILHVYLRRFGVRGGDGRYTVHQGFLEVVRLLARRPDGWYVPVATLLDRLRIIRGISIESHGHEIVVRNETEQPIAEVALRVPSDIVLQGSGGSATPPVRNEYGQVLVGTLLPGTERRLVASSLVRVRARPHKQPNELALMLGHASRVASQFFLDGRKGFRLARSRRRRRRAIHAANVLGSIAALDSCVMGSMMGG